MEIKVVSELPEGFEGLAREASSEGHNFLLKMAEEWNTGKNRFDREGEILFTMTTNQGKLIGVGGLNVDPYISDPSIGRVRHVYVSRAQRGSGLGKVLLKEIIKYAMGNFKLLRLRTHNPVAVEFYKALGFDVVPNKDDKNHTYLEKSLA